MKFAFPFVLLLTGCTTTAAVSLPLHGTKIVVPAAVERHDASRYLAGYKAAWAAYLKTYAADIDYKREFLEDVATGDAVFLRGWYAGRDDCEEMLHQLIAKSGREAAKAELAAALTTNEPNHSPEPTQGAVH